MRRVAASLMICVGLAGCSAFAVGCGSDGASGSSEGVTVQRPTLAGILEWVNPPRTPKAMAGRADVVVVGETGTPQDGPILGTSREDPGALLTTVVPISVDSVESGSLPAGSDGTIYLQLTTPETPEGDQLKRGMTNRSGIFYLSAVPKNFAEPEITNADAGRPAGQFLHQISAEQGILLVLDGGDVWSVGGAQTLGTDIDDLYPSSEKAFGELRTGGT